MVDRHSQSSKQPIKRLRFLRFSFTQHTQRNRLCCVRCVWMETGLEAVSLICRSVCLCVCQGYKEVTLLGQNVNSYRDTSSVNFAAAKPPSPPPSSSSALSAGFHTVYRPKSGGLRFADLLRRVADVNPQMRIRFTSPHPKDFPDEVNTRIHS